MLKEMVGTITLSEDLEFKIETSIQEVMKENGGSLEIFNHNDISRVSLKAGVCTGIIYDYFKKQLLGDIK